MSPGGRRTVTILFCDLVGSTALGERLDPEALRRILGRYYAIVREVLESHGGTVEKFIGDAVMAVFGVPVLHEDDALRAVRAADALGIALDELNLELGADAGVQLAIRVGIQTGEVAAGDQPSDTLVTGDAVNTAARLEQAADPGEILIGAPTYAIVANSVVAGQIPPLKARGKSEPLRAYRLRSVRPRLVAEDRRPDTPFIGRRRELNRLREALDAATANRRAGLATIVGDAGVGKTRLIAEFLGSVPNGTRMYRGRCLSYGAGITYWPIGEIVRAAAGITDDDAAETARRKLGDLLRGTEDDGAVALRVAAAVGLDATPVPPEEVPWAVRRLLEVLATAGPTVLVVDDVHWAEPALLDLLDYVVGWSAEVPLLVCTTTRPDLLERRPDWSIGPDRDMIRLEPLDALETDGLVSALLEGAVADDVASRIRDVAGGNPLFIEQLTSHFVDQGVLKPVGGRWEGATDLAAVPVPATIGALLAARLDQLEPLDRELLERASVIGLAFTRRAVLALSNGAGSPGVVGRLFGLARRDLVRPDRSAVPGDDAFRFRHQLVRDAAYGGMSKARRAELHERFADWLEAASGERIVEVEEIVGYHLEQAHRLLSELGGSDDRTVELGRRAALRLAAAGRRAVELGDTGAAVSLLERSFDLIPVGATERLGILRDLGYNAVHIGRIDAGKAALQRAIDDADAAGLGTEAIRARVDLGHVGLIISFDVEAASQQAKEALAAFSELGDEAGMAKAWHLASAADWFRAKAKAAVDERERARALERSSGSSAAGRLPRFWGAEAYGPLAAVKGIDRMTAALEQAGSDRIPRAEALFSLAGLLAMRDDINGARRAYLEVGRILTDLGLATWAAACSEIGGVAEWVGGDLEVADRILADGAERLVEVGAEGYLATLLAIRELVDARLGRRADAKALSARLQPILSSDDVMTRLFHGQAQALWQSADGQLEAAEMSARAAVAAGAESDFLPFIGSAHLTLARILRMRDSLAEARAEATVALDIFRRKGDLPDVRRAAAFLEKL